MKIIFILLTIVLFFTSAFAQSTMKLVYFNDYSPFSWMENNQMKGILIDALTEAIQTQMGIQVSHKGYPWERAQKMVKFNEADAFVTVPTLERKSYTEISTESVILVTFTLFVSKKNAQIEALKTVKNISDLSNFSLVQNIGSGWATQNPGRMNVRWIPTLDKVLFLIAKDRYDIFVDASQVIRFNIKKLGYQDQILELPNIIDSASFNLCIGKKSPYVNILPKFDATIIEMRKNGKLQEIYDKYR